LEGRVLTRDGAKEQLKEARLYIASEYANAQSSDYDRHEDRQGMEHIMSLTKDLRYRPPDLGTASKYTVINGVIYLGAGVLLIAWPGAVQTLFRDPDFIGHEQGLVRVIGLTVVVIGWLYLFGARTGGRQVVAASVIDRLVFVPIVLLPLAFSGVFPHLLVAFTILDMTLATGAWVLSGRTT
jgi:hypothetical protein